MSECVFCGILEDKIPSEAARIDYKRPRTSTPVETGPPLAEMSSLLVH